MENNSTYNAFFAQHYDFFYTQKKAYAQESLNLLSTFKKYGLSSHDKILDVGCGTGEHALHIAQQGHSITGIDISPFMIQRAQEKQGDIKNINFICQPIEQVPEQVSYIYSLFNVINCLETEFALKNFIKAVARALNKKGIFIFDCWHTEAILQTPPSHVLDYINLPTETIKREVFPVLDRTTLRCSLSYSYSFKNKTEIVLHELLFFRKEIISSILSSYGFKILEIWGPIAEQHPLYSTDRISTYVVQKI